eukprot:m.19857 g.19857  ORF g.19857 m.19857 type:complete len:113 (-) comp8090_c0_seq1:988-1326(-)
MSLSIYFAFCVVYKLLGSHRKPRHVLKTLKKNLRSVLEFCEQQHITQYMCPSHTTQIYKVLDQAFDLPHRQFGFEVKVWRHNNRFAPLDAYTSLELMLHCMKGHHLLHHQPR